MKGRDTVQLLRLQNPELRERQENAEDRIEWLTESMRLEEALDGDRDAEEQRKADEPDQGQDEGADEGTEGGDGGVFAARVKKSSEWKDSKVVKVSNYWSAWKSNDSQNL